MALVWTEDAAGNGYWADDGSVDYSGDTSWLPQADNSDIANSDPTLNTGTSTDVAVPGITGGINWSNMPSALKSLFTKTDAKGNTVLNTGVLGAVLGGLGGAAGLGQVSRAPTGYQGGIPRYTAVRQAAAPGQRLSGNVTYTKKAEGGELESGGFVIPADVVSHFGNGSSDAGLKLLAAKLGAEPIRGEGDGMSDSIATTIDGREPAKVAHEEAFVSRDKVAQIGGGDARKGAQKLRDMMARIREARTGSEEQGKQINPNKFMPGGAVKGYAAGDVTGSAISSGLSGSESNLSNWAGPYVTDMLGKGQALSEMPFEQYGGPLTAGPSALQTQAFDQAAKLQTPSSIGQAAQTAGGIADKLQGLGYTASGGPSYTPLTAGQVTSAFQAPSAYQAGVFDNQFNAPTQSAATQFTNQYKAPAAYTAGAFNTGTFDSGQAAQYMNPYLQAALEPQLAEARRQADISRIADASRLTKAGAYGGARQAIMESEGRRNLGTNLANITGQGYATAYDKAMQQFNTEQGSRLQAQQLGEQSRQFGATQAATAAQLQAQYGLSAQQAQEAARQFNQGQALTAAQLQAQYGLSAQQAQEASRQFGAQQGLAAATTAGQQGLQAALANQQAGLTAGQGNINAALQAAQQAEQSRQFGANYGLQGLQAALQAAQMQGQFGINQNQANLNNLQALASLGATQRGIESEGIAADKAAFEEARANPYKMVQFQQSLLSGLPLAAQSYNVSQPSTLQQILSGIGGGASLGGLTQNDITTALKKLGINV